MLARGEEIFPELERAVFNIRDIDYNELNKGKKAEEALKSGKKIKLSCKKATKNERFWR